jgi:transcription antitermination factor NusG
MQYCNTDIFWYVLFVTNGKADKIKPCLEEASIEYFFPVDYNSKHKIGGMEHHEWIRLPLLGSLIFVKSSKSILDPVLREAKSRLSISSDLYYRNFSDKRAIIIPENQMQSFIAVAKNEKEQIMYLSNEEINFQRGVKAKITGGVFAGAEGVFMRLKGNKRLVVSIPNLFSVASAYIPSCYVQEI